MKHRVQVQHAAALINRITCFARLSVCLSVPSQAPLAQNSVQSLKLVSGFAGVPFLSSERHR